ncbi:MAG: hypothetical protein N2316_04560 [Spirochaetes bacterium]|nr:hypothetical protein [Spirochaetota bacterium]
MNKDEIERLINLHIKRLKDEYELLNTTILNAMHRNIDIMIENSEKWFGDNIPQEFRDVLSSLMTLTYLYYQENSMLNPWIAEINYEEFKPDVFVNNLITDIESVLGIKNVIVHLELVDSTLYTSKKILRDSLLNIFLSMTHFMTSDSIIRISLYEKPSIFRLTIRFEKLGENFPDINKLTRAFYSYYDGTDYRINIGLSVALENLRNIGVVVKIVRSAVDALEMEFSLPTMHFFEMASNFQKSEKENPKQANRETIILCIDDAILEMILSEALSHEGLAPMRGSLMTLREGDHSGMHLIVEYAFLRKNLITPEEFAHMAVNAKKAIVIHNKDEKLDIITSQNILTIGKPFEIEQLITELSSP